MKKLFFVMLLGLVSSSALAEDGTVSDNLPLSQVKQIRLYSTKPISTRSKIDFKFSDRKSCTLQFLSDTPQLNLPAYRTFVLENAGPENGKTYHQDTFVNELRTDENLSALVRLKSNGGLSPEGLAISNMLLTCIDFSDEKTVTVGDLKKALGSDFMLGIEPQKQASIKELLDDLNPLPKIREFLRNKQSSGQNSHVQEQAVSLRNDPVKLPGSADRWLMDAAAKTSVGAI
mgnify:FL=1